MLCSLSNRTRMIWPDDLSPARGEMFSPDWGIRSTLLKTETQLGPQHHLCPSSSWTDENRRRKRHEKGQRNLVFSPSFSLSLSVLLSVCTVPFTERSLIFLVNVLVLLCFQWGFILDSTDCLNADLAFYFTICLACFASQFINCSFTHSLFILSASPQSVNDVYYLWISF